MTPRSSMLSSTQEGDRPTLRLCLPCACAAGDTGVAVGRVPHHPNGEGETRALHLAVRSDPCLSDRHAGKCGARRAVLREPQVQGQHLALFKIAMTLPSLSAPGTAVCSFLVQSKCLNRK